MLGWIEAQGGAVDLWVGKCCFPAELVSPFSFSVFLRLSLLRLPSWGRPYKWHCSSTGWFESLFGSRGRNKSLPSSWCCRALSVCERGQSVCLSLFSLSFLSLFCSLPLSDFPVLFFLGFKVLSRALPACIGRNIFPSLVGHQVFGLCPDSWQRR